LKDLPMTDERHNTLDAVRGFAVMGILLMNIVSMGMPTYAYIDPLIYGNEGPADLAAWFANYVLADGKMRALFTMLFGASMVLIAERASAGDGREPAATHYRRMFWLFVFGMVHAWLIWHGDILVLYAIAGSLCFLLWRANARSLWAFVLLFLAIQFALNLSHWSMLDTARTAASVAAPSVDAVANWQEMLAAQVPTASAIAAELAGFRGGVASVFETRAPLTMIFQTFLLSLMMAETLAFIGLGIVMYRNGFLLGRWSRAAYWRTIALGYMVAVPLTALVAQNLLMARFDIVALPIADTLSLLLRPFIALAHAAAIILFVQSTGARWLSVRLAAAGRMALSNYIGTSIVATTIFYGYGLGYFGHLSRWQLYAVVALIWVLILAWSKPWLDQFLYGPIEWLWRSLARGQRQPMRK
jgi:uncharacterized protein